MTTIERLTDWRRRDRISEEQYQTLATLVGGERFSLYLELNALLYLGVAFIAGGIGWVVRDQIDNIGDGLIIAVLALVLGGCLYFCFRRAAPYSNDEIESPTMAFDYVLYLGALVFGVLLGYLQVRIPPPAGPAPEAVFLISAVAYFGLAYRFDNRLVLSLGFTALAGLFGLTFTRWGYGSAQDLIVSSLAFAALVAAAGSGLYSAGIKRHFLDTYVHLAALTALVALLVGSNDGGSNEALYLVGLIVTSAALAWVGYQRRSAWLICYGLVFAYLGISIQIVTFVDDLALGMLYVLVSGIAVVVALVVIARKVSREP